MNTDNPVSDQSVEEWLSHYDGSHINTKKFDNSDNTKPLIEVTYSGHRTTKLGRLVLEFVDENYNEYVIFFNCIIRGKKAPYRTGAHGQFNTNKKSKFRKFWRQLTNSEPASWSRVHHLLKRHLTANRYYVHSIKKKDAQGYCFEQIQDLYIMNSVKIQECRKIYALKNCI